MSQGDSADDATAAATAVTVGLDDAAPATVADGETIGRYTITGPLGAGGMGTVLAAFDADLERKVAIKILHQDRAARGDARARLLREAQAMAKLSHPNVVAIYEAGADGDRVFLAMELVEGETLRAWLAARRRSWREIALVFERAGRGLAAAHAAGLVHRDFKPDNVLVGDDGRVRVCDFGLVAVGPNADDEPAPRRAAAITLDGVVLGTPLYMAPEQHRGLPADERADQYAFCAALAEALAGRPPFDGVSIAALADAKDAGFAHDGALAGPRALRRAVVRGLAADPAARWPSMDALLAAIARALRRTTLWIALGAAVAAAAIAATFAVARTAPIDACAADAARAARIWGPGTAAKVRAALAATGRPYAAVAASRAIASLDRFTVDWYDVRAASCRDADAGRLDAAAWQARAGCLDGALDALRARTDLLLAGGDDAVQHAGELAALAPPGDCAHAADRDPPLPNDPAAQAAIRAAYTELERLRAAYTAGRYAAEIAPAEALALRADALGWAPLADRARQAWVDFALAMDQPAVAEREARVVAESAAARGDDRAAVAAWRAVLDAMSMSDDAQGLDFVITAARGAARRSGRTTDALVVEAAAGGALLGVDRLDEARTACQAALDRGDREGADDAIRVKLLECLNEIASRSGDARRAFDLGARIVALDVRDLGPGHPLVATAIANQAISLHHLGDAVDALVLRWTAHAALVDAYGADSGAVADSERGIAIDLADLGGPAAAAQAVPLARRAVALATRAWGAGSPRTRQEQSALAYVLSDVGDHAGAIEVYAQLVPALAADKGAATDLAIAVINDAGELEGAGRCAEVAPLVERALAPSPPPPMVAMLEAARIRCQLAQGDAAGAKARADQLLAHLSPDVPSDARGDLELSLARALVATGGDRDRARTLARAAQVDLADPDHRAQAAALAATLR